MSVSAYVLIQTDVGKSAQVAGLVAGIEGVVSSEGVMGPYDVIARAETPTDDDMARLVVGRIQLMDGITRTLTCPIVNL